MQEPIDEVNINKKRPVELGVESIVPGKKLGRKIGIPTCKIV